MKQFTNEFLRDEYLREVKERSPGSFRNAQIELRNLMSAIKTPFQEITRIEIKDYLKKHIDNKKIKKSTKNAKRYILIGFFNFIENLLDSYKIEFENPVPTKKKFQFSTSSDDIQRISDKDLKVLSIEQIRQILDYSYEELDFRDFLMIELDIVSGARISEIRTIQTEDVNIPERTFQTGFIYGARKTTTHTQKGLMFFYPESVARHIGEYLEKYEKKTKRWLFPGYNHQCLSQTMAQDILQDVRSVMPFDFTWHYFRRSLITHRIEKGCEKWISKGLANHKPSDVQERSYIKFKTEQKRAYYDEFFPYSEISYFQ